MPNFDRFNKRWSATGVTAAPTDLQSDAGFAYLQNNPPTAELFNALFQRLDDKDNWLYSRVSEVLLAAGITPTDATQNQLLTALRTLFAAGLISITATQSIVVPAGVTRMHVCAWGGGGGGGGAFGQNSAGTGGAGGGYTEGIFPVTPNASILVTVGKGGLGAPASNIYTAQAGGTTSFGSFCSATGGAAGLGGNLGYASGAVTGGTGFGGNINLQGTQGGFGQVYAGGSTDYYPMGGGIGGGSPFGGGLSHLSIGAAGNAGIFPGGGGCGAGSNGATVYGGGNGADGFVIVEW